MCRQNTGLIGIASLFGLFQSLLWGAVSILAILVYCCVIPIAEYNNKDDFFRVTTVKLYFEGSRCNLDGGYLGNFFKDPIHLLGREMMMFMLIAYLCINFVYFFLSLGLYIQRRKSKNRVIAVGWSLITLILCVLDVLTTYALVMDASKLMDHIFENPDYEGAIFGMIPYIPLLLAIFPSRLVVVWLWNFFLGLYVFFTGMWRIKDPETPAPEIIAKKEVSAVDKALEDTPKVAKSVETKNEEDPNGATPPSNNGNGPVSLVSSNFRSLLKINPYQETNTYRQSLEGVTRFSDEEHIPRGERPPLTWCYAPPCEMACPPKLKSHREWEHMNPGYMTEEQPPGQFERMFDFDQNLRNFESAQKKVARPQVGKPIPIPVPPPLPNIESYNC